MEHASKNSGKPELRKGFASRSFDMATSTKTYKNSCEYSTSPNETRKRSVSLTSQMIDDYMREENTKQLNKKEFEEAYQKVYGGNASNNSTLSVVSDSKAIWSCGNYVEAARFFL